MTSVVLLAVLEVAWRLFANALDAAAWQPNSLLAWAVIPDALFTLGLLAAHRRAPRAERVNGAEALRRARLQGAREESRVIGARMAKLIGEQGAETNTNDMLRALRTIADSNASNAVTGEPSHMDRLADATLARIGRELRAAAPPGVTIRLDFSEDLGPLRVDARELRNALHRVAHNAILAMPNGGRLRLRAAVNKIGERNLLNLRAGHWMRVEMTDSGYGMSPEALERCQDPFFSRRDEAVGLGLTAVGAFTRRYGGAIEVQSIHGNGTSVTLWLPACLPSERRSAARDLLSVLTTRSPEDRRFITQP